LCSVAGLLRQSEIPRYPYIVGSCAWYCLQTVLLSSYIYSTAPSSPHSLPALDHLPTAEPDPATSRLGRHLHLTHYSDIYTHAAYTKLQVTRQSPLPTDYKVSRSLTPEMLLTMPPKMPLLPPISSLSTPSRRTAHLLRRRTFSHTPAQRTTDRARLVEVGPRDGLQNEERQLAPETKMQLIRSLAATGLSTIEAGSFVSRKLVPQVNCLPLSYRLFIEQSSFAVLNIFIGAYQLIDRRWANRTRFSNRYYDTHRRRKCLLHGSGCCRTQRVWMTFLLS